MRRGRAHLAAMVAAAGAAAAAWAQPFSATLAFEASTDGGQSWQGGLVELEPGPRSVRIRIRADWTPEAGYAFRNTRFDVVIQDAAAGDSAAAFLRPVPFDAVNQTIVATRFGTTIKIDDARDTHPPDVWEFGVSINQHPQDFNPEFNADRPVTVFHFDLNLDGTLGDRTLDALVLRNNFNVRASTIYTSPRGDLVTVSTTTSPLTVRIIPAPGPFLFAPLLAFAWRRRPRP